MKALKLAPRRVPGLPRWGHQAAPGIQRSLGRKGRGLQSRIIPWLIATAMVILAVVSVITFLSYRSATENLVIERDREVAYLSAARLKEELNKFTGELETLARNEDMQKGSLVQKQKALERASRRLSVFDGGVIMLDNFGYVVATLPDRPEIMGQDWSDRSYFAKMLGTDSPVFSNVVRDGPGGSEVIVLAVPVYGSAGESLGLMAGMFRLGSGSVSAFYASIVKLRLEETGEAFLVDGTGRVLYHANTAFIGQDRFESQVVRRVVNGETGAVRTLSREGRAVVSAYAPVPGTPWGLVGEEDWAALTGPSRFFITVMFVLLGVGMLLPGVGVTLYVRQRHKEELEEERAAQEMRVAGIIQQTLLPRRPPELPGWRFNIHWQPAREVGGDFYDFFELADGRIGVVFADVTDKGVPAALVMASTRSILRSIAAQEHSPGRVLALVNEIVCPDMPRNMFVTCLYGILDPAAGRFIFANAGQNLPQRKLNEHIAELDAVGLPLGLIAEMDYEEKEVVIEPGEIILFYSDGLVEAHNGQAEMFGEKRVSQLLSTYQNRNGHTLIDAALVELALFTGADWEQEDDVTLMTMERSA